MFGLRAVIDLTYIAKAKKGADKGRCSSQESKNAGKWRIYRGGLLPAF